MHRMDESMQRFEAYSGWRDTINPTAQEICREFLLHRGYKRQSKKNRNPY